MFLNYYYFFEKVEIIAQKKTIKSFMKPQRFFEGFEITRTCTYLIAGFFLKSRTGQHCYVPNHIKFHSYLFGTTSSFFFDSTL